MRQALWPLLALAVLALACTRAGSSIPTPSPAIGSAPTGGAGVPAPATPPVAEAAGTQVGVLPGPSLGAIPFPAEGGNTGIWVQGVGRVTVEPDLALVTLTVEAQEKGVEEARVRAAEAMARVQETLQGVGVAQRDIQTVRFSIQPVYRWRERVEPDGTRTGEQVLEGYRVTHTVRVKVRDLERVGEAVDRAVSAGGDLLRVQGITFTVEDVSAYQAQARALAVQDALAKARQFAELTGVQVGPLRFITESVPVVPVVPGDVVALERASQAPVPAPPPTPIATGELQVEVRVQAVFEIR